MKLIDIVDQNLLREYGLIKTFDNYSRRLEDIDQAMQYGPEDDRLLKLLEVLDKQDLAMLKIIQTYLELRLAVPGVLI